jgi:hypothetical protein
MPSRRKHDDVNFHGPAEPTRTPYVTNAPLVWPPCPAQCPRCQGLVVTQYEEPRCYMCGWRLQPIPPPPEATRMKYGAQLPTVIEVS